MTWSAGLEGLGAAQNTQTPYLLLVRIGEILILILGVRGWWGLHVRCEVGWSLRVMGGWVVANNMPTTCHMYTV